MTLEELFDCSAEKLQAMSDEELKKHFEPYFDVTRPERATREKAAPAMSPDMQFKLKQLASLGIDINPNTFKKRKK